MKWEEASCPLCNIKDSEVVFSMKGFRGQVYVSICVNDGMLFLNPRWNEKEYEKYYKEEYHKTYKKNANRVKKARACITRSLSYLPKKLARVLDIGAGEGWLLNAFEMMKMRVGTMEAIEPGTLHRAVLLKKGCHVISSSVNNDWHLMRKDRYDFIVMRHVLEHLLHPEETLEKVNNVLSKQGALYIAVPDALNFNPNRTPYTYFEPAHVSYFSPDTLKMITASAGLELVHLESVKLELFGVFKKGKKNKYMSSVYEKQMKALEEFKKR